MKRLIPILVTTMCLLLGYIVGTSSTLSQIKKSLSIDHGNKMNEVLGVVNGMYVDDDLLVPFLAEPLWDNSQETR